VAVQLNGGSSLGERIAQLRSQAGLSARELAAMAGFRSGQSIYAIETGRSGVSHERLLRIARALRCNLSAIAPPQPKPARKRGRPPRIEPVAPKTDADQLADVHARLANLAARFAGVETTVAEVAEVRGQLANVERLLGRLLTELGVSLE
jgi:transcriptional regulator with XRE-family HTH domain